MNTLSQANLPLNPRSIHLALPVILVPHPHVRVEPTVLGGSPYVAGSRVPVRRLWAFYDSGVKIETLLKRFPQLDAAKVFDALAFALDNLQVIEADIQAEREILQRVHQRQPGKPKNADSQMDLPFTLSRSKR